jgi:hypothetical protein
VTNTINIIYHINILTQMIIKFQDIKYANSEWHKNLTNVNIGIFLKIEYCEGGSFYMQGHLVFE